MQAEPAAGPIVTVTIEIPRWSFVKYAITEEGGKAEFISPLPCPFNYGFVAGVLGGDGMPLDAIVLGPRVTRSTQVSKEVKAVIRFVDNGEVDDKLVCSARPISRIQIVSLQLGFRVYVGMKRVLNFCRNRRGATRFRGIEFGAEAISAAVQK